MKLINVIACVIIGCLNIVSSVPFSEGNVDRNGQETEWLKNQKPLNEFRSQQFSVLNRNNEEFIPRNNYQNNAGTLPVNNILKNGFSEFINHQNYPNYNSLNKFQSNVANQENYQNFATEINELIARENLLKMEMGRLAKLREANIQQNYRPNIIERSQQPMQQQNYYHENNNFGAPQPSVQNHIRPQISQFNIPQQKIAPQENPEGAKKSFLVTYPNGVKERVYDLDAFIKSHPSLNIERRRPILPSLLPQQHLQKLQTVLQQQPTPQILQQQVPLPAQQIPQKPLLQQSILQQKMIKKNAEIFSSSQQNNLNPIAVPHTINSLIKSQLPVDTKAPVTIKKIVGPNFSTINKNLVTLPATKNVLKPPILNKQSTVPLTIATKQNISRTPISTAAAGDMLKGDFETINQTKNNGSHVRLLDNKSLNLTNKTLVTTKLSPVKASQLVTPKNEKKAKPKRTSPTIVSTQTTVTLQNTPQNGKLVVDKTITKNQSPHKNIKSKNDNGKKILSVQKNAIIPELVLKIAGESVQTKPTSQSEKITVSEEVITVQPTKQEIEIEIAKIIEREDGTEVIYPKNIFISDIQQKIKQKDATEPKSDATIKSVTVKKDFMPERFNRPVKQESYIEDVIVPAPSDEPGSQRNNKNKSVKYIHIKSNEKKNKEQETVNYKHIKSNEKKNKEKETVNYKHIKSNEKKNEKKETVKYKHIRSIDKKNNSNGYEQKSKKIESEESKNEIPEEEPECEDELLPNKKIITRKYKPAKFERNPYKEGTIEEIYYEHQKDEKEPDYIRELKDSLHNEKLFNEEIIENGEKKHQKAEIKHEHGITVFTSDASKSWVEEVNNAERAGLEKELKTADPKHHHWLAKEAFVFKTSDATIPEFIKQTRKHHKKPIFLFQFVFPPTVDREIITTIHPDGRVTEKVKEYLCDTEQGKNEDETNQNEKKFLEVFEEEEH